MATRIAVIVDYAALLTERVDHAPTLGDVLCKREHRLSTLLKAHSLASRLIKRTISFGLNLHGAGYDVLRSPLSFGENIPSHGPRLGYEALSINVN
jgi:hypothetical protein